MSSAPPSPSKQGPTAPTTGKELGFFAVPTCEWDPADGNGSGWVMGTVTFTEQGCPVMSSSDRTKTTLSASSFPTRKDSLNPHTATGAVIYSTFGDGTSGTVAEDGQLIGFHGRTAPADDNHWKAQCAQSPVDAVF